MYKFTEKDLMLLSLYAKEEKDLIANKLIFNPYEIFKSRMQSHTFYGRPLEQVLTPNFTDTRCEASSLAASLLFNSFDLVYANCETLGLKKGAEKAIMAAKAGTIDKPEDYTFDKRPDEFHHCFLVVPGHEISPEFDSTGTYIVDFAHSRVMPLFRYMRLSMYTEKHNLSSAELQSDPVYKTIKQHDGLKLENGSYSGPQVIEMLDAMQHETDSRITKTIQADFENFELDFHKANITHFQRKK